MKPTVLIGLGGIGSETVDNIYGRMTEEEKKLTAVAILDTDIRDLQKHKHVKVKIQTSPAVKVGNYVYHHPEVKAWFPYQYEKINQLMLSAGAGQVRALSRLAFYSALDEGRIYPLDREIKKLTLLTDSQYNDDINVVIVGSINGGTCSGSFLQMGLYMRRYFYEKNPNASVFIQGVFLLPHAITKTGAIVESEWDNLEFNAYSALKELNAVMSPSIVTKTNIQLEYRPGVDSQITLENRPYDNILFFDYENSRNQHLDRLSEYKLLLSETVYNAYISPISSDYQSRFVNTIRNFIANNQESFYSASSVNKLIYPYEDIIEYLSLEWMIDEIDQQWLKFDKDYDAAMRSYVKSLDAGVNLPKPQLSEVYIESIDRLEHAKKRTPFEGTIFRQTRIIDEKTSEIKATKDDLYFEALVGHIEKAVDRDSHYQELLKGCTIESANLESIKTAPEEIETLEYNLKVFESNIDKIIQRHKSNLLHDIVSKSCDSEIGIDTDMEYNINHWVMPGKEVMHPVSTRYFLYRLRHKITTELEAMREEVKTAKENVESYKIKHDIPSDMDAPGAPYFETAEEVMAMISGQTLIGKIKHFATNNQALQFKPFIRRFRRHYKNQVGYISILIRTQLKQYVLQDIANEIDIMIENWETLFENLGKGLMEDMKKQRNRILHKHEGGKKDIYIFASPENKMKLWKEMREALDNADDRGTLFETIGQEQNMLYCKVTSPETKTELQLDKTLYKTLLLDAYKDALRKELEKKLNVSLDEAVRLESHVTESNITLADYLQRLENKNLPWMHIPEEKLVLTKFWGVSNKEIFGNNPPKTGGITESKLFSNKEIVYLVMYHNLSVTDFAKFAVRGTLHGSKIEGAYFKAYRDLMKKIAEAPERYVTPHIDKRWDALTYMPDLNKNVTEQIKETQIKAFLFGLIEQNIYSDEQDGKEYFYANDGTKTSVVKVNGKPLEANRWLDLYRALSNNPAIVDAMIELHQVLTTDAMRSTPWEINKDPFVKMVKKGKVIKIIADILTQEVKDEASYSEVMEIVKILGEIINGYISEGFGEMKANTAAKEIEEVKAKLIADLGKKELDGAFVESIKRSLG